MSKAEMREDEQRDTENASGPDWKGFARILAIGRLRRLGIEPTPPEVLERKKQEKEKEQRSAS